MGVSSTIHYTYLFLTETVGPEWDSCYVLYIPRSKLTQSALGTKYSASFSGFHSGPVVGWALHTRGCSE